MSRYNIENFKFSFSNLENKNMDDEIFNILSDLAKKLNCSIDKTNKKIDNETYWNTIKNFKATQIKNTLDDENKYLQNIRKILNMITQNNYSKFDDEIINNLNYVKNNFSNKYESICKEILKLLSNNYLYSKCYSLIFKNLLNKIDIFKTLLDDEINNFETFFDTLIYVSPEENYEKFCEYNKKNENRRAKILFYSNLYLIDIIDDEKIYKITNTIFNKLNENLIITNKNNEIDEMSENNYILITTIYSHLSKNNIVYSDNILNKVTEFSNYKIKDFTSLTNKCIFKHMDIIDEIS